jgi:hypothetical protein
VSALLPQPGGFEGLSLVQDAFQSHDLSATKSEEHEERDFHGNAAPMASRPPYRGGQDRVSDWLQLLCLDHIVRPLPQEFTHVGADPFRADLYGGFRQRGANDEEDVGVEVIDSASEVPLLQKSKIPRTSSKFSCDIARSASHDGVFAQAVAQ